MFVALLNLYSAIIEVRFRVNLFRVYFPTLHDVAFCILIVINVARRDFYTEGNKETILDTLFQRISIYRLSKVGVCVGIVLPSWCGSHTQLISGIKVIHQLSPFTFIIGTTSMTLINNDKVEEIALILQVIGLIG